MATWVYPPIPPDQLKLKEDESLARELQWLLGSLQDSLASLKEGLQECVALLAPKEPGSTLALSSLRSENVKGFVTRVGTRIVKGDINLRLSSLAPNVPRGTPTYPSTRYTLVQPSATSSTTDLTLLPLLSLANHLNACLDIIDVTRWTGQSTSAPFISGQLRLLSENLSACRACLKGGHHSSLKTSEAGTPWWLNSVPAASSTPPIHPHLSLHFSIHEASLVLTVRTLSPISIPSSNANPHDANQHTSRPSSAASTTSTTTPTKLKPSTNTNANATATDFPSLTGFNIRDRLFNLGLGSHSSHSSNSGSKNTTHDEMGDIFDWRRDVVVDHSTDRHGESNNGTHRDTVTAAAAAAAVGAATGTDGTVVQSDHIHVQVREKVRVESGDPSLISVAAKLSALEHEVRRWRFNLGVVMGEDDDDDDDDDDEEGERERDGEGRG